MYLIDELPIRYDLKLFQFILNLMVIICLVQKARKSSVEWLKLIASISSNNKRNWNKQQYVGKTLRVQGHCGTLVPNNVHWFPSACYDQWFEVGICLGFCIFRCEEALPRDGLPRIWDVGELGRWVTAWKGIIGLPEGLRSREGRLKMYFFW